MIVSDSSTLIILLDLGREELLSNLFDEIIIPQSVHDEITVKKKNRLPTWMRVVKVESSETLDALKLLLDKGESEAIALSIPLKMPLIINEKKGRKIALNKGVKIIGLLGIIYLNIQKGHLTKNEAQALIGEILEHGYRISLSLIKQMLDKL